MTLSKLVVATLVASLVHAVPISDRLLQAADDALYIDDECRLQDDSCALNAAQLRAHKKASLVPGIPDAPDVPGIPDAPVVPPPPTEVPAPAAPASEEPAPAPAAAPAAASGELAKDYGQCGGAKWKGSTQCSPGFVCVENNEYYSQCSPEDQAGAAGGGGAKEAEPVKMNPLKKNPPMPKAEKVAGPLAPIVIKGNFLYNSDTGDRFFAKGIAYNPRNIEFNARQMRDEGNCTPGKPSLPQLAYAADPTIDKYETMWRPALQAMADAGMNTVRLYNVDPEESHEKFMAAAAELGLYVVVPLTRHDWGFLPTFTAPECYTGTIEGYGHVGTNLLTSAKLIVKQFSQWDNVLMFTVANELTVNDQNGYAAYPCVKALARDIHQYQSDCSHGMRRIPLIYADMDMGAPDRKIVSQYLTCKLESEKDVVDAHGLNVYSWCDEKYVDSSGKESFQFSPYSPIVDDFKHFDKPVLMTEFGCNIGEFKTECPYKGGRTWPDIKTFFNQFSEILSGGIAFEFSMEDNEFGVAMTPGFTSDPENDNKIYLLDGYYALSKEFHAYDVSTKWNGAEATSCSWKPSDAAPLSEKHSASECPSDEVVAAVFKRHGIKDAPNWNMPLPPTPPGADQDALAECPAYKVSPTAYKEGCCHNSC